MKIGVTETYDPCYCIDDWIDRSSEFDMVIFITKVLSDDFIKIVTSDPNWKYDIKPSIIHLTCTGWGGSWLEPNVPSIYDLQKQLDKLILLGYPTSRIVLRVDPIIPTKDGLKKFYDSVRAFKGLTRVRISVLDMYYHVVDRLKQIGEASEIMKSYIAPDGTVRFTAKTEWFAHIDAMIDMLKQFDPDLQFECCGESKLFNCNRVGCVSELDYKLNNLIPTEADLAPANQRQICKCLNKSQLIPGGMSRGRCPNKCLYCYLKDFK